MLAEIASGIEISREYFVGWGTLALIVAGIAQGKNRSGLGWFIGALFLGPIALLILVLLDKPYYEYEDA